VVIAQARQRQRAERTKRTDDSVYILKCGRNDVEAGFWFDLAQGNGSQQRQLGNMR
jgi:hypothetical protein